MTIHREHPFAGPEDAVRRLRGRIGGAVSLWTSGEGTRAAGLTVSSFLVARGEPGQVAAMIDPDSELRERFGETGHAVLHLLDAADRPLADAFGATLPAPGGAFKVEPWRDQWEPTRHGPLLRGRTYAMLSLDQVLGTGWMDLVVARIDDVSVAESDDPLEHRRGRYRARGEEPEA